MSSEVQTVLAFDYGTKRIGVAVGQTYSKTAEPLTVLQQRHGKVGWPAISKIIAEWQPDQLVVGFPRTADGSEIPLHLEIRSFCNELKRRFSLPITYCDEHLSSFEAKQLPQREKHGLDALAAQVILETWLNL